MGCSPCEVEGLVNYFATPFFSTKEGGETLNFAPLVVRLKEEKLRREKTGGKATRGIPPQGQELSPPGVLCERAMLVRKRF